MPQLDVPGGHIDYLDTGAGDTLIVLLHAGYVDRRMWDDQIDHLGSGARVIAPDARAHGQSSTPFGPFRQCDDVAALIRHLDAGPAILIGTSMGAGTAVDTALEYPDLVRALVISGAGTNEPVFEDPWSLSQLARLQRAMDAMDAPSWIAAELDYAAGPDRTLDDLDPTVVERLRTMHEHFVATHVRPGIIPPDHVVGSWERLPEISVPVLGIVGDADGIDHHRMCERAVASVQDGRGVACIKDAGHYPNLERPAEWDALVDGFLADVDVVVAADARSQRMS
jgi:pimeloyl-ACP methyl ester carboxylesterase